MNRLLRLGWLARPRLGWLASVLLLLGQHAWADLPPTVAAALQQAGIPQSDVAIVVQRMDAPVPAIALNAERPFNPASTMKLLTTYAALDLLGPAYRWRTEAYREGEVVNGVLNGNLAIKGYGDPALMAEDLQRLVSELRQSGLREIRGNLVLDGSYFLPQLANAAAFDGEGLRAYNALPGALYVNLKSTSFKFTTDGAITRITTQPLLEQVRINNQMRTVTGLCSDWRGQMRYQVNTAPVRATQPAALPAVEVLFTGNYSQDCGEKYLDLSLFDSNTYFYLLFRQYWQQSGGTWQGTFEARPVTQDAYKLQTQQSLSLSEIIWRTNKYSNNLMARQLLLTVAAEKGVVPATEAGGINIIKNWLSAKSFRMPELVLENGSGLSRSERISAAHMSDLLQSAYGSPLMPEFVASLPLLAVDGTVAKRSPDAVMAGRAHLKTGSLNGVGALAGYAVDAKGRYWRLVFMVNHPQAALGRLAQDALLDWIYRQD